MFDAFKVYIFCYENSFWMNAIKGFVLSLSPSLVQKYSLKFLADILTNVVDYMWSG